MSARKTAGPANQNSRARAEIVGIESELSDEGMQERLDSILSVISRIQKK